MKTALKILILIFLILITPQIIKAEDVFTKSTANPLKINFQIPNWSESLGFEPHVIFDQGIYKMWYASFGSSIKVAYATSIDGLTFNATNVLDLYPNHDNHDPFMFIKDGKYTLYFASSDGGGQRNFRLNEISSTDGVNFNPATLKQILLPDQIWESNGLSEPFVYYKNNTYYLFYTAGSPSTDWSIGLATSTDGINWNKCPNTILQGNQSPTIYEKNGVTYLLFKTLGSIQQMETTEPISCQTAWQNHKIIIPAGDTYDVRNLNSPSIIERNGQLQIYYSAYAANGLWTFNLATSGIATRPEKEIYVLLPGLMGSWNNEAILHNQTVAADSWKLNKFVNEYDGIIATFKNLGYISNTDFYVFPYDWRKSINDSAVDLNNFLPVGTKVNLIGHSLGGLVARSFAQSHPERVKKIITIGSPHHGTAQVYKPLEAGQLDRWNNIMWLSEKIILAVNKNGVESDKETLKNNYPVLMDLFPSYDFLVQKSGATINHEAMIFKNLTIQNLDINVNELFPTLTAIAGNRGTAIDGFRISEPTSIDKLLGNYPDGRPINTFYKPGDYLVTADSEKIGNSSIVIPKDHSELIYSKEGIKKILEALTINYQEPQIVEGRSTTISPAMLFLVQSAIDISVIDPAGQTFPETDGYVYIPNPVIGNYRILGKGTARGKYRITVGKITNEDDSWQAIQGEITATNPGDQLVTYAVNFLSASLSPLEFDQLIAKVNSIPLQKNEQKKEIIKAIGKAKRIYLAKNKRELKEKMIEIDKKLAELVKKENIASFSIISDTISQFEDLYTDIFRTSDKPTIKSVNSLSLKINERLEKYVKKSNEYKISVLNKLVNQRLEESRESILKNNLNRGQIKLYSINNILDD